MRIVDAARWRMKLLKYISLAHLSFFCQFHFLQVYCFLIVHISSYITVYDIHVLPFGVIKNNNNNNNNNNKLCGRPPQYAPPPVTLTFDL